MKIFSAMCGGTAVRGSCKPDTGPAQTDAPFVGDTTNRCDYTRKPTAPPQLHNPDPYLPPEGQMSSDTTNRCDFDRKPLKKTPAWRPKDRRRPAGQFEVSTTPAGLRLRLLMQNNYISVTEEVYPTSLSHLSYRPTVVVVVVVAVAVAVVYSSSI